MATDISGVGGAVVQQRSTVTPQKETPASTQATPASELPTDDTVSLQSTSQVRALSESVRDQPVVDGKRVQALREAIATGTHQVDPNRVAEKLVALEAEIHPADA